MNVLSLFAGIGGLDLGLERAGMTVVGQVEIDPFCQRVLAKHWPEVPRHDDVRTAVEWWLGRTRPAVDVVCGGFPCQPVSLAGRRQAQADERWLWPAMWAVIRDLRPRWAVLENVPGLLVWGAGDVLGDLAEIGYDAEWDCIPAAAVGAPHRRDRVFVVAYPGGEPGRPQSEPVTGRRDPAVAGDDGPAADVADADRDGQLQPGGSVGQEWRRSGNGRSASVADAPGNGRQPRRPGDSAQESRGRESDRGGIRENGMAYAHGPRRGPWAWLDWSRPSPLGAGWWAAEPDVGRVAHGVPARVDRLRALGNAVVPQVAEHVGRLVMEAVA